MKTIYLVIEQSFFNSNGCDYAMSVDPDKDINLFDNYDKAMSYFEERGEEICRTWNIEGHTICQGDEDIMVFTRPNYTRTYLKIIKKTIR